MLIYRQDVTAAPPEPAGVDGRYLIAAGAKDIPRQFATWVATWGWVLAVKTAAKVCTGRRMPFGFVREGRLVASSWANIGFCRHYPVEPDAVVLGTAYTEPRFRGKGLQTAAMRRTIAFLQRRGFTRFYADTTQDNLAARRLIEKAGFTERVP